MTAELMGQSVRTIATIPKVQIWEKAAVDSGDNARQVPFMCDNAGKLIAYRAEVVT